MSRGRKPSNIITSITWDDIFWKNLPTYINILNSYLNSIGYELVEVSKLLDKLPFKLPKGLNSKEINSKGIYPVISQSKEFIIGFNDNYELLVKDCLPLIVFGDHSKTIKYVEKPFIIGADGVKILKPIKSFNEKFFYYFLHGVITDTKDYGRHFSLLRKGVIANVTDSVLQNSIVNFLDDLSNGIIYNDKFYFNNEIERKIYNLQTNQLKQIEISSELTHQLDLIKQLRRAYLREAMQGKLVGSAQLKVGSETGHDLLAKIKAEKAKLIAEKKLKKEKELPPITTDEIPFEIPEHWAWCRLGEILKEVKYGTSQSCDYDTTKNTPVLRIPNVSNGEISIEDLKYTNLSSKERTELSLEEKDILIIRSNGSRELVGKTVLVKKEFIGFCYAGYLIRLRYNSNLINSKYLWLVTKSPFFREMIETPLRTTVGINNINTEEISLLKVPLPPLHEQEQIVAKLEELMAFCDGLEECIKESQGYNEMLLQQVLREALQGEDLV